MEVIHAFLIDSSGFFPCYEELLPLITVRYREKFEKLKLPLPRMEALAAGWLLREFAGIGAEDELSVSEQGKPYRKGKPFFNLSHSDGLVLLACADSFPVGADVERIGRANARILRKVSNLDPTGLSDRELTVEWTRVEASLKRQGTGFFSDPKSIDRSSVHFSVAEVRDHIVTVAFEQPFILELELLELVPGCNGQNYMINNIVRKESEQ